MIVLWICLIIIFPFLLIFYPLRIIGKKYIKNTKKNPVIYCANHQTNADAVLYKARVCPTARAMAKKNLFKFKPFGWLLKQFGAYPVDRGANDIQAIKTTLKYLKTHKPILLFPEGTRVQNADAMDIKNGLALFAIKADAYVIPSYFRKITKPFVFNTLLIGKPFKFSDYPEFKDGKTDKETLSKATICLNGVDS